METPQSHAYAKRNGLTFPLNLSFLSLFPILQFDLIVHSLNVHAWLSGWNGKTHKNDNKPDAMPIQRSDN